jgi:hypothetical protein
VATLIKTKRNEVARINIVQAQAKEVYFIFDLEYRNATLSRAIPHRLPTKSQYSTKPKNPSEMRGTQWPHSLHLSLNPGKSDVSIWPATTIFQILDVPVLKRDVLVSTG